MAEYFGSHFGWSFAEVIGILCALILPVSLMFTFCNFRKPKNGKEGLTLSTTPSCPKAVINPMMTHVLKKVNENVFKTSGKRLDLSETYTISVTKDHEAGSPGSLIETKSITLNTGMPRRRHTTSPRTSLVPNLGFPSYTPCSSMTNRAMITNAVDRSLFRGPPPGPQLRTEVLEVLSSIPVTVGHFLILFRNAESYPYRGLYCFNPNTSNLERIHGNGPPTICSDDHIDVFLKFNSATKSFEVVKTKHLSITIDGFTIPNSYWLGKKGGALAKMKLNRFM